MKINGKFGGPPYIGIPPQLLRIMKLTTIIMMMFFMQVSALTKAQITLKEKGTSLQKVLETISKQSGYDLVYSNQDFKNAKPVTIKLNDVSVIKALEAAFEGQPLIYEVSDKTVMIKKKEKVSFFENLVAEMKAIDVTGRVFDDRNLPLEGATIVVKGTSRTARTDAKGEFVIPNVPDDAVLVIRYVGYRQLEIGLKDAVMPLEIKLNVATGELEEVNVKYSTGYQKISKERATGSFSLIDSTLFNRQIGTNLIDRLDGTVSGVLFDRRKPDETFIQVRGLYTLTPKISSPLIVLDNFPYEGDLANINPNDVENITILKDAAAASIWGARAGNGVIVVTTKRSRLNQPFRLNISSNITAITKSDIFGTPQMSSSDFIDVEKMLFDNGAYDGMLIQPEYYSVTPVVEILAKLRNNEINQQTATTQIDALRNLDLRDDYKKYVYRTGVNQQHALNLSGGGKSIAYYVSTGFDKNLSTNRGSELQRINLNSKVTLKPIKKLQLTIGQYFTKNNAEFNGLKDYSDFRINRNYNIYPYARLADDYGNPLAIADYYGTSYTDTAGGGKLLDWKYRPLQELKNADNTSSVTDIVTDFITQYEIAQSLNAEISYRYERTDTKLDFHQSSATFSTRDLINLYTNIEGGNINYAVPMGGILNTETTSLSNHAVRGQLNFSQHFGKHSINALSGVELRQTDVVNRSQKLYGFNKETLTSSYVDNINYYPLYIGGSGKIGTPQDQRFGHTTNKLASMYANAAYVYDNRYTLTASARQDATNLFGVLARNKWKPLWSAGLAWNIASEDFYKIKFFPYLNLRVTYGYSGNVNNSITAVTTTSRLPAYNQLTNIPFATIGNIPNPELRWEKVRTTNIGIDFAIINRSIWGSIDYYEKKSTDVIAPKSLDPTTGVPILSVNSAHMLGKGLDVNLNSKWSTTANFSWNTTLNFSYVSYKVTRYLLKSPGIRPTSDGSFNITEGQNPYSVISIPWGGLDPETGNPMGILNGKPSQNLDSVIRFTTSDDLIDHGPALPKFHGNFLNTVTWKGIGLSANITYKLGYFFRKPTINYISLFTSNAGHSDFSKRWQKAGDEKTTNVPSMVYPTDSRRDSFFAASEINIGRADHIRLEDIRLSYNFGNFSRRKLPFSSIQIFAIASNLNLLIWKANKWGVDPDYPGFNIKPGKNISMGVSISL